MWKWKSLSGVWLFVTHGLNTVHWILQTRILEWVAFFFSQGIFPTQGSNPGVPHYRQILYQLSHRVWFQFSSVHSVESKSLRPHEPQHARPPCPSPTPRAHPKPCALSWWCHPTISSSIIPFSSCPQSFPASGSFLMSCPFTSGGQSIGASTSATILAMKIQGWFLLGLTGVLAVQGTLKHLLQHHN